jgi:hypothetical protein
MKDVVKIRELSIHERDQLLKDKRFGSLKPVQCNDCGFKDNFFIKLFQITGAKIDNDNDQEFIRYHMNRQHGFVNMIFRVSGKKKYVETAFCGKCGSNSIMFDIEFTDEILCELSRLLKKPPDRIKKEMEQFASKLETGMSRQKRK